MSAKGCVKGCPENRGFSLIELLVVIGVIAIISAVAIPNIANVRGAAADSNVQTQEKQLNNVYRSLKSASTDMPSTKEEILDYLANDPRAKIVPPETLDSSEGTLTLTFDSEADLFTYTTAQGETPGGGESENPPANEEPLGGSDWNPPANGVTSNESSTFNTSQGQYPEAWFRNNEAVAVGSEEYYLPQAGGYQFEPFRVSVAGDGSATLTTQSGQTYDMQVSSNGRNGEPVVTPQGSIHWQKANDGSITVSSIVSNTANS